jgi:hypothetical protein
MAAIGQAVGAVFTAAAVAVALWLAIREGRWRRAEQADRDAAQARLVTVQADYRYPGHVEGPLILLTIKNSSDKPVFDAKVSLVRDINQPDFGWRFGGTGDPEEREYATVLSPGESFVVEVVFIGENRRVVYPGGAAEYTITFTDALGLRWSRQDTQAAVRIIDSRAA